MRTFRGTSKATATRTEADEILERTNEERREVICLCSQSRQHDETVEFSSNVWCLRAAGALFDKQPRGEPLEHSVLHQSHLEGPLEPTPSRSQYTGSHLPS